MAVQDDVAAWIASEVDEVGLLAGGVEIDGGGYARLAPSWTSPADGEVDLDGALEFGGLPGQVVDAVGFWRSGALWFTRTVGVPVADRTFSAEGRLDLDRAPIAVEIS